MVSPSAFCQRSRLSLSVDSLSNYIVSPAYKTLKDKSTQTALIDSIYLKALNICGGDISESLYALMFVFLQHPSVTLDFPAPVPDIIIPLLTPDSELFNERNELIPRGFLFDSKYYSSDDRDKLSHFFGSAFLGYNNFSWLTLLIGNMIEASEELLIVRNKVDHRDLKINFLGFKYGERLRKEPFRLPSSFVILYNLNHYFIVTR